MVSGCAIGDLLPSPQFLQTLSTLRRAGRFPPASERLSPACGRIAGYRKPPGPRPGGTGRLVATVSEREEG